MNSKYWDLIAAEVKKLQKTVETLQERCNHYAKLLDSIGLSLDVDENLLSQSGVTSNLSQQHDINLMPTVIPQVILTLDSSFCSQLPQQQQNCQPAGALILAPNFVPRLKPRPIVPKLIKSNEIGINTQLPRTTTGEISIQTEQIHMDNCSQTDEIVTMTKETETHQQTDYHLEEVVELVARGDSAQICLLKYGEMTNFSQPQIPQIATSSQSTEIPEPIDKGKTPTVQPTFDFSSMFEPPYTLPPLEHFLSNCNTNETPTSWNFSLKTSTITPAKTADISYQLTPVNLPVVQQKSHNFSVDFLQNGVVNRPDNQSYPQTTVAKNPTWSVNRLLQKDQKCLKSASQPVKSTVSARAKRTSLTSPGQMSPAVRQNPTVPEVNLSNSIFDYNPGKRPSKSSRTASAKISSATTNSDYQISNWLPISSSGYASTNSQYSSQNYTSNQYQQQILTPLVSETLPFDPYSTTTVSQSSKKVKVAENSKAYGSQELPSTYAFGETYGPDNNFSFYLPNNIGPSVQSSTTQSSLPRTVRQPNSFQISSMLSDIDSNNSGTVEDANGKSKSTGFCYSTGFPDAQITSNNHQFEAFMTGYSTSDPWQYQPYNYWPSVSCTSNN